MKTLVLFYSYSGNTKARAQELASREQADIEEVLDVRLPGKLKAYTAGIVAAIRGKAWPIRPLRSDLASYDRLVLFTPVWADNPAPPFSSVIALLPPDKSVRVIMVSASGKSKCRDRLEAEIAAKGCTLEAFEDIT